LATEQALQDRVLLGLQLPLTHNLPLAFVLEGALLAHLIPLPLINLLVQCRCGRRGAAARRTADHRGRWEDKGVKSDKITE
jgi:hypothetical protein